MGSTGLRNNDVDLDCLDDFLLSDRVSDSCMGLSDLDGFLTGIAVGPELILPSEWLPVIWGSDAPEFANIDEAMKILGTIMSRYVEIIVRLDADPDGFDPVLWEGPEGDVVADDWAAGFLDAVRLRAAAWEPLVLQPASRALLIPMLLLGTEDDDRPPLGEHSLGANEMNELGARISEIIPASVLGIRAFWRKHSVNHTSRDGKARRRSETRPRRR
jgi:uncharacterized protein